MISPKTFKGHQIPEAIKKEAEKALSFYPQLKNTPIIFKFKKEIAKSTMQAQPVWQTLFYSKKKRRYIILISEKFKIDGKTFYTKDAPFDVLVGWLGHELGHVMDYKERSSLNLIFFGARYIFLQQHIKKAERTADVYAINQGMEKYIMATKDFILNQAGLSSTYLERIKKYYLSPEDIMQLVKERDSI
ncbi:hypothetical protein ACJD0Z_07005 [Flavobacteriaceae bacterium M23B6Z8]